MPFSTAPPRRGGQGSDGSALIAQEEALSQGIKELFLQEELPSNPFPALANKLCTHVDRAQLWGMNDHEIVALMASSGDLEVVDDPTKLCKLRGSPYVWGLPHVLYGLDAKNIETVMKTLEKSLPASFFPSAMEEIQGELAGDEEYTLNRMTSMKGYSLGARSFTEFPQSISVQMDIAIKGVPLDSTLNLFAQRITDDIQDLVRAGIHIIDGARLEAPASKEKGEVRDERDVQNFKPEKFLGDEGVKQFQKVVKRATPQNQHVQITGILALDITLAGEEEEVTIEKRYVKFLKKYVLHHYNFDKPKPEYDSYTDSPFDALYHGVFTDQKAAREYIDVSQGKKPYAPGVFLTNEALVEQNLKGLWAKRNHIEAFSCLHLFLGLKCRGITRIQMGHKPAAVLLPLIEEKMKIQNWGQTPGGRVAELGLSAIPDLQRLLSSAVYVLRNMELSIHALCKALEMKEEMLTLWGKYLVAAAEAAAAAAEAAAEADEEEVPQIVETSRFYQVDEYEVGMKIANCMTDHISHVVRSIFAILNKEYCAGTEGMLRHHLSEIKLELGGEANDTVLLKHLKTIEYLFGAACTTMADGLLSNKSQAKRTMDHFAGQEAFNYALSPGNSFDVAATIEGKDVPTRLLREAAAMHYAVETGIDMALASVYLRFSKSPLMKSPHASVVQSLRTFGVGVSLATYRPDDYVQEISNKIVSLGGGVYVSRSKDSSSAEQERTSATPLYGAYSAVAFASEDVLSVAKGHLEILLAPRARQNGACDAEIVTAFCGSAFTTRCGEQAGNRFLPKGYLAFDIQLVEHSLIVGTDMDDATELFAESVVRHASDVHANSQHIFYRLSLRQGRDVQTLSFADLKENEQFCLGALKDAVMRGMEINMSCCCVIKNQGYSVVNKRLMFYFRPVIGYDDILFEERKMPHSDFTYTQVFATAEDASKWSEWEKHKGVSTAPVACSRFASTVNASLQKSLKHLDFPKVLEKQLLLDLTVQNYENLPVLAQASGMIEEVAALKALCATMRIILTERTESFNLKIARGRLKQTFTAFKNALEGCISQPHSCPFPALIQPVMHILSKIKVYAKTGQRMHEQDLVAFEKLDAWLSACIFFFANSSLRLMDCSWSRDLL